MTDAYLLTFEDKPRSVRMTCTDTRNNNKKSVFTLTEAQLLRDLASLQTVYNERVAKYKKTPGVYRCGLYGDKPLWVSLNHQWFLDPSTRLHPDEILSVLDGPQWTKEVERYTDAGYTVEKLVGDSDHTVYVKMDGLKVRSISDDPTRGGEPFDLQYHVVENPDHAFQPVVHLLPRLLTGTCLCGSPCFVYFSITRRNPVLGKAEEQMLRDNEEEVATLLVNTPYPFRNCLEFCSDDGRAEVIAGEVPCSPFEKASAVAVSEMTKVLDSMGRNYYKTLPKAKKRAMRRDTSRVLELARSENGRDAVQIALQYAFDDHVAHVKAAARMADDPRSEDQYAVMLATSIAWQLSSELERIEVEKRDAASRTEKQRLQELHDAREAAERAEEKAIELHRKLQAMKSRAEAAARAPTPYTVYKPPPKSSKLTKKRNADRVAEAAAAIEHTVHVLPTQRAFRADRFELKQQIEHEESEARKSRAKEESLKIMLAKMSAAREAATHVVPNPPTLLDAMGGLSI